MLFRVLGPIEVHTADGVRLLPGGRSRALLAALLLRPGHVVDLSALTDAVWGDNPPQHAENAVRVVVRRLRVALGADGALVETRAPGYSLAVRADQTDAGLFELRYRAARAQMQSQPAAAVALFEDALSLWRGAAYAEFADSFAQPAAVHLEELRRAAAQDRAATLLTSGELDRAIAAARDLTASDPLAERPLALLMQSLAATGRTAEALAAYHRHTEVLRNELGLDPPATLRELHGRILRGDHPSAARAVGSGQVRQESLPLRPSGIVGRENEVRTLTQMLDQERLVTLVGPGGVGKTRLALEYAHHYRSTRGRAWWVDLAPVTDTRVVETIAGVTGAEINADDAAAEALCTALASTRGLMILDNAEHLLDAVIPVVELLHHAVPGLLLLITSRERLALDSESVQRLPPLPLPQGADGDNPAVRLFVARAHLDSQGASAELSTIAQVCRRLDGLPLAIELAAAQVVGLGLPLLLERIDERLDVLTGSRRTAAHRHRTLRAVVEWSHDLLTSAEATLFRRLAVFPSAFTLAQAETICQNGLPAPSIPQLLSRLVEQSLVQQVPPRRFLLLETLRTYGRERLSAANETERTRRRHARDTHRRLTEANERLWTAEEATAVQDLTDMVPDLHAAWAYSAENDDDLALRLAGDIYYFAYFRQRLDLLRWGLRAVTADTGDPERLPPALGTGAAALWSAGSFTEAAAAAERGIAAAGGSESSTAALPLLVSADIAMFQGHTSLAIQRYRQHTSLRKHGGEPVLSLLSALSVAHALINAGQRTEAADVLAEAVPQAVSSANPTALAWAFYLSGEAVAETNPTQAAKYYDKSIRAGETANSRMFVAIARSASIALATRSGSPTALADLVGAFDEWIQLGYSAAAWLVLHNIVAAAERFGADNDAAVLAGAAHARRHSTPGFAGEADRTQMAVQRISERRGPEWTAAAMKEGSELTDAGLIIRVRNIVDPAAAR